MNRLRGEWVIVDLSDTKEDKDAYEKRDSGIVMPKAPEREGFLTKGTVVLVGESVDSRDIKVGDTVYVKKMQGDRLTPDKEEWIFREAAVYGTD